MTSLRLTDQADLGVMFDAEQVVYPDELPGAQTGLRERFIAYYSQFESVGYEVDGVAVGGAIFDGEEFHLAVLPHYQGRWTWLLKPTLQWLFLLCDPVRCRISKTNLKCVQFADHSRFPRVSEDEEYVTYELSKKWLPPFLAVRNKT